MKESSRSRTMRISYTEVLNNFFASSQPFAFQPFGIVIFSSHLLNTISREPRTKECSFGTPRTVAHQELI